MDPHVLAAVLVDSPPWVFIAYLVFLTLSPARRKRGTAAPDDSPQTGGHGDRGAREPETEEIAAQEASDL